MGDTYDKMIELYGIGEPFQADDSRVVYEYNRAEDPYIDLFITLDKKLIKLFPITLHLLYKS